MNLEIRKLDLREAERAVILQVLRQCDGNAERAAEFLKIGKSTMYRKIVEYEITDRERYV